MNMNEQVFCMNEPDFYDTYEFLDEEQIMLEIMNMLVL